MLRRATIELHHDFHHDEGGQKTWFGKYLSIQALFPIFLVL